MEMKLLEKEKAELERERQQEILETFDEKTRKSKEGVDMTDAEKFLNDTFGGWNILKHLKHHQQFF